MTTKKAPTPSDNTNAATPSIPTLQPVSITDHYSVGAGGGKEIIQEHAIKPGTPTVFNNIALEKGIMMGDNLSFERNNNNLVINVKPSSSSKSPTTVLTVKDYFLNDEGKNTVISFKSDPSIKLSYKDILSWSGPTFHNSTAGTSSSTVITPPPQPTLLPDSVTNTYKMGAGQGKVMIQEHAVATGSPTEFNKIVLDKGIGILDFVLQKQGNNLVVDMNPSPTGQLIVKDFFLKNEGKNTTISYDGVGGKGTLTYKEIMSMVTSKQILPPPAPIQSKDPTSQTNAMIHALASFSPPTAVSTSSSLTPSGQSNSLLVGPIDKKHTQ